MSLAREFKKFSDAFKDDETKSQFISRATSTVQNYFNIKDNATIITAGWYNG